jgi:hypothetical protein
MKTTTMTNAAARRAAAALVLTCAGTAAGFASGGAAKGGKAPVVLTITGVPAEIEGKTVEVTLRGSGLGVGDSIKGLYINPDSASYNYTSLMTVSGGQLMFPLYTDGSSNKIVGFTGRQINSFNLVIEEYSGSTRVGYVLAEFDKKLDSSGGQAVARWSDAVIRDGGHFSPRTEAASSPGTAPVPPSAADVVPVQAAVPEPAVTPVVPADRDFEFKDGTITKYVGWDTAIIIPAAIGGVPVRTIGREAFKGADLVSAAIPDGVVEIGVSAFTNNKLRQADIPGSVRVIKEGAFSNNQLTEVSIFQGVTAIEKGAFRDNKITKLTIPGTVRTIGESAFANNLLTDIVIPEGVAVIEGYVFFGNRGVRRLTLPGSIRGVAALFEADVFHDYRPPMVVLGEKMGGGSYGVEAALGTAIFYNYIANDRKAGTYTSDMRCEGKTEGDFTYYETQYGAVLTMWTGGNRLRIPERIGGIPVKAIGINHRYSNPRFAYASIDNLLIPEGITYIGDRAFCAEGTASRNNFAQLAIPPTVTYIGDSAFRGGILTQLVIPGAVTYLGKNAFSGNAITSLAISDGVACIEDEAFLNNKLTRLTLPASVAYLGASVAAFVSTGSDSLNMRLYPSGFSLVIGAGVGTGNDSFGDFYTRNGKQAGRYTTDERSRFQSWSYRPE